MDASNYKYSAISVYSGSDSATSTTSYSFTDTSTTGQSSKLALWTRILAFCPSSPALYTATQVG